MLYIHRFFSGRFRERVHQSKVSLGAEGGRQIRLPNCGPGPQLESEGHDPERSNLGSFKCRIRFWNGVGDPLHFRQLSLWDNTKQAGFRISVCASSSRSKPIYRKDLSLWIQFRENCKLMWRQVLVEAKINFFNTAQFMGPLSNILNIRMWFIVMKTGVELTWDSDEETLDTRVHRTKGAFLHHMRIGSGQIQM